MKFPFDRVGSWLGFECQGRLKPDTTWVSADSAVLATLAAACGGGGGEGPGASNAAPTLIQLDGSSTVFPISEAVAEEFQKANPNVRVTVGISGTGGGFQKFCRGETDISDASRPIRPTEIETCKTAGIEYIELPIALRRPGGRREPQEHLGQRQSPWRN